MIRYRDWTPLPCTTNGTQAITHLESAHDIMPDEPGLLTNLGLALKHNNNNTKAEEHRLKPRGLFTI
ncbi:tetratricopeptide repeat protein [Kaarinaea lacus]